MFMYIDSYVHIQYEYGYMYIYIFFSGGWMGWRSSGRATGTVRGAGDRSGRRSVGRRVVVHITNQM